MHRVHSAFSDLVLFMCEVDVEERTPIDDEGLRRFGGGRLRFGFDYFLPLCGRLVEVRAVKLPLSDTLCGLVLSLVLPADYSTKERKTYD